MLKGAKYDFVLSYRFPAQLQDQQATAQLKLGIGESLRLPAQSAVSINSHNDKATVPIAVKKHVEDEHAGITFTWAPTAANDPSVLGATHSIDIHVKESSAVWVQLGVAVALYTLLESLRSVSLAEGQPARLSNILAAAGPQLLVGFGKALTLLWMIRLFGKKVV